MSSRIWKTLWTSLAAAAALAAVAAPAAAQEGRWFVEIDGGVTFIGGDVELDCPPPLVCIPEGGSGDLSKLKDDFDDDAPTFGIGVGKRVTEKVALLGSIAYIDGDDAFGEPVFGVASDLDIDVWIWDFSVRYFPRGGRFFLLGGIGWATVEAEFILDFATIPELPPVGNPERSDDAFTAHAGLGGEFDFSDSAYFLAQAKFRYLDSNVYDDIDIEALIGIGFRFGGG